MRTPRIGWQESQRCLLRIPAHILVISMVLMCLPEGISGFGGMGENIFSSPLLRVAFCLFMAGFLDLVWLGRIAQCHASQEPGFSTTYSDGNTGKHKPSASELSGSTEIVSMNDLISLQVDRLRMLAGADTDFAFQSSRHLFTVCVDSEEIRRAMDLMCRVVVQGQQEFGRMIIRTQNVAVEQGFCTRNPWAKPGCYVLLTVSDLDADESRRQWGETSSLDAPTCQFTDDQLARQIKSLFEVVAEHGGFMRIRGKLREGVEIGLFLPIAEALDRDITQYVERARSQSSGVILLAEDEDFIRELTVKFLKNAGYYVLVAHDGLEARKLFEKYADYID
ncbi:MAG TPA: hypothetical protein PKH07_18475, partial [bacterium]|nr:hypothetical protein [bacterium]